MGGTSPCPRQERIFMQYPIVRVTWIDSSVQREGEWVFASEMNSDVMVVESVGWLIRKDDEKIVMSISYAGEGEQHQYDSPLAIPVEAIRAMDEVRGA